MKLKHLAAALVLTAGTVFAQETASVRADVKQMHVYMPQSWAVRQGSMISNKLNAYEVILAMTKTNGKKPAQTGIRIWAGDYGFCPLTQSFQLEVNGIPLKKLNVKASDVQPWKEGKNTGLKIALGYGPTFRRYVGRTEKGDSDLYLYSLNACPEKQGSCLERS